jgi:copper transport protein
LWIAVREALNAGLLGSSGAVLFLLFVARSRQIATDTSRIATRFALVGIAAAILSLCAQGGLLTGAPLAGIIDITIWQAGLTSVFGRSAVLALVGLAVIAAAARRPTPVGRATMFAGAVIALSSYAVSGHVVTAGPRWMTTPALLVHTSAVAFWIGSLLPLRAALSERDAPRIVRRFSTLAVFAVGLLIAAGLVIAVMQVRGFGALVATTYGWLLLAKLALVAGLLSLATFNKHRLTPALERRDPGAADALRRTIAAELAVVALILIVTVSLGTTPPPRALQGGHVHSFESHSSGDHSRHGLSVHLGSGNLRAELTFLSALAGLNSVEIAIGAEGGTALEAKEVTLAAANPAAGVAPIRRMAQPMRPGVWEVKELALVPAGEWSIRVEALVSDFEKVTFEGAVQTR